MSDEYALHHDRYFEEPNPMIQIHETFPTRRDAEVWAAGYRCQYHPAGYGTRLDITKGEGDLSAAAPDMLAVLKSVLAKLEEQRMPNFHDRDAIRAAIAKAEGETWIVSGHRYSSCD